MKPTLRIVHHLHRTGGTLISKCIASLPNISLLSEVNPNAELMVLDPVFQASFWLRLMNNSEAEKLEDASFSEKITVIHRLAAERGEELVIRNWAYLDFFGLPFTSIPSYKLATENVLSDHFELKQIVTVRHPMDQWLSWCAYRGSAKADDYTFRQFVDGCSEFQKQTAKIPYIRYEDFVAKPLPVMREICQQLGLEFDPVFHHRWPYYHQITGDDNDRSGGGWVIKPRPRRQPDNNLMAEAEGYDKYIDVLQNYGYL